MGDQYYLNNLLTSIIFQKLSETDSLPEATYSIIHTFFIRYMADEENENKQSGFKIERLLLNVPSSISSVTTKSP
jgi:hypothetical protein